MSLNGALVVYLLFCQLRLMYSMVLQANLKNELRYPQIRSVAPPKVDMEMFTLPLFVKSGKYFVHAYVGTPLQRISLKIDTATTFTVIPCKECSTCSPYTNHMWDRSNSSTIITQQCKTASNLGRCIVKKSTSVGNSWTALRVEDRAFLAGINSSVPLGASAYNLRLVFGCLRSVEGTFGALFAQGVLGMGNSIESFQSQMMMNKVTKYSIFSLCFHANGGFLTLGGTDGRFYKGRDVGNAVLTQPHNSGIFSVNVLDVLLRPASAAVDGTLVSNSSLLMPISTNITYLIGGNAVINSETPYTALPFEVAAAFQATFQHMTGLSMQTKEWTLSEDQLVLLPSIVFRLQSVGFNAAAVAREVKRTGKSPRSYPPYTSVDIEMPWRHYLRRVSDSLYAWSVHFTLKRGHVLLGNNFLSEYYAMFDMENKNIGFAASSCDPAR